MESFPKDKKEEMYKEFLSFDIPGVVFCRELAPDPTFLKIAVEEKVPVFMTKKSTSAFMAEIIRWLNVKPYYLRQLNCAQTTCACCIVIVERCQRGGFARSCRTRLFHLL